MTAHRRDHERPGRATGAPRASPLSWSWLGPRPVLRVRGALPDHPDRSTWSSAASGLHDRRARRSRTTATCRRRLVADAYRNSIEISLVTAIVGGIFGFLLAYAVIRGGLPPVPAAALMTFSGVASNFAGIPLALAFIFTLGRAGLLTALSRPSASTSTPAASRIYSKLGLEIVYLYFQFPLMVLIIAPAIDGLKRTGARPRRTWARARSSTGATSPCRSSPRRCSAR